MPEPEDVPEGLAEAVVDDFPLPVAMLLLLVLVFVVLVVVVEAGCLPLMS